MRDFDSEIFDRSRHDLVRYATVLVGPGDAESVLSTAVTRVLSRGRLEELEQPRNQLFRAVLDESRATGRRRSLESADSVGFGESGEWNFDPEVWDTVQKLPLRQRAATFLFYWMEMSVSETADMMGLGVSSVKRHIRQARSRLGETLDG